MIAVALGVDTEGRKHVLGLPEGATETAAVATGLFNDLVRRGLAPRLHAHASRSSLRGPRPRTRRHGRDLAGARTAATPRPVGREGVPEGVRPAGHPPPPGSRLGSA